MKNNDDEGGIVPTEQIRIWLKLPFERRLQWLEEASEFAKMALPFKVKKMMEKQFGPGELK